MRKLLMIVAVMALFAFGCASQTVQQTAGTSLLAMHDAVKIAAETSNTLCVQKVIPAPTCASIKVAYDKIRQAWPIVDDALVAYLKAPITDTSATIAFNVALQTFTKDYAEIMALCASSGVLKGVK